MGREQQLGAESLEAFGQSGVAHLEAGRLADLIAHHPRVEPEVAQLGELLRTGAGGVEAGSRLARRRTNDPHIGEAAPGAEDGVADETNGAGRDRVAIDVQDVGLRGRDRGRHLLRDRDRPGRNQDAEQDVGLPHQVFEARRVFHSGLFRERPGPAAATAEVS